MTVNAPQVEYWNGPAGERWAMMREAVDTNLAAITSLLYDAATPRPGERVLDLGCGCGTTTIDLHGRTGNATGIDVSAPMLAIARQRAPAIDFVEADAATHTFPDRFDLAFSRFGVMFFTDPVAGFANIKRTLVATGRIVFACWREIGANPWVTVPLAAAGDLLPAEPPPDPDAPGPFALADGSRLEAVLAAAGFHEIRIAPHDTTVTLGPTIDEAARYLSAIGPLARRSAGLEPQARTEIRRRITAMLERDGTVMPAAIWIASARP